MLVSRYNIKKLVYGVFLAADFYGIVRTKKRAFATQGTLFLTVWADI